MADAKISALPASTTPLAGTEVLPVVQSSTTKQVSVANLTAGRTVAASSFQSTGDSGFGTSSPAKRVDVVQTYRAQIDPNDTSVMFGAGLVLAGDNGTNQSGAKVVAGYSSGGFGLHLMYSTNNQAGYASNPSLLTYAVGAKLTDTGDLKINVGNIVQGTAAKGINFTANTSAAGMTSQLLNWYEEGTWTPNQGAGLTLVGAFSSAGTYTRIGRQVFIRGSVSGATSVTVASAGAITTNLPYSAAADATGTAINAANNASSILRVSSATLTAATAIAATTTITFSAVYSV